MVTAIHHNESHGRWDARWVEIIERHPKDARSAALILQTKIVWPQPDEARRYGAVMNRSLCLLAERLERCQAVACIQVNAGWDGKAIGQLSSQ